MAQHIVHAATTAVAGLGRASAEPKDFFEVHAGLWALGSAMAAFLSLLVGGVGLFFIWAQLKAGREALPGPMAMNVMSDPAWVAKAAVQLARVLNGALR